MSPYPIRNENKTSSGYVPSKGFEEYEPLDYDLQKLSTKPLKFKEESNDSIIEVHKSSETGVDMKKGNMDKSKNYEAFESNELVSRAPRNRTQEEKKEIIARMRSHKIYIGDKEFVKKLSLALDEEVKEMF